MMWILRVVFSIGSPREKPDGQWQEIEAARRKLEELERRVPLSEGQHRYFFRSSLLVGGRIAHFTREEAGS